MSADGWLGRATGVVRDFDEAAGWGNVTLDDDRRLFFHCTAIADGSRTIEPGTAVDVAVVAGRLGRWEAADLRRRGPVEGADPAQASAAAPGSAWSRTDT